MAPRPSAGPSLQRVWMRPWACMALAIAFRPNAKAPRTVTGCSFISRFSRSTHGSFGHGGEPWRTMEDSGLLQRRVSVGANPSEMIEPLFDDPPLLRFRQRAHREDAEFPPRAFGRAREMATTNHEDQRLAVGLRKMREVLVQIIDCLEINVEIGDGGRPPE